MSEVNAQGRSATSDLIFNRHFSDMCEAYEAANLCGLLTRRPRCALFSEMLAIVGDLVQRKSNRSRAASGWDRP